jgi:transcriptional regulator with XRE-family HTH domain
METTIENRIVLLRKTLNLNQTEFANKLSITQTTVSGWDTGKSKITEQNIKLISLTFKVNEEWLCNGIGEMFISADSSCDMAMEIFRKLSPQGKKAAIELLRSLLTTEQLLGREILSLQALQSEHTPTASADFPLEPHTDSAAIADSGDFKEARSVG